MPKKRVDGVRWQPVGSARPDRAQWHTSSRAIVLPPSQRATSSRYRAETWRPAPGRPAEETNHERAKRRNQQQAMRGTMPPKTKRQGRRVGDQSWMAKQTATHEGDWLRQQRSAAARGRKSAAQKRADKKAKKIAARARHEEVRAIMAAAGRLNQERRKPEREPTAEERRENDRQRSERERAAARKRDQARARAAEPATLRTATPSAPAVPVPRPAEAAPRPPSASSLVGGPAPLLPSVQPSPGLMPTFIATPPRCRP